MSAAAAHQGEEDRADPGDAERHAERVHRLQDAGGRAHLVRPDAGHHDVEERHEHHAHPDPADHHRGQQVHGGDAAARGPQHRVDRQQPGRLDDEPGVQDPAAELAHRDAADRGADEGTRRPRRGGNGRVPRAEAQPVLQEHVEDHHDAAQRAGEHDREHDARAVRPVPEQGRLHQRVAAGALAAHLVPAEPSQRGHRRGQHPVQPGRPAQRVSLRQREDQQEHGHPGQHRARQVQPPPPHRARAGGRRRPPPRQQASAEDQRDEPDRHVHREDHPPAGTEQVGADQPARRDRPEHRRQAHDRSVDAERLPHLVGREQVPDQAEDLRQHDRPEQALDGTGGDELTRRPGHGARRRRGHEPGDPGQQHPPPPEDVAEPPAGQQPDRHGQGVGGGDPLDHRVGAAEFAPDRRRRDLRDGRVEQVHHRRRDDHAEGHPPPPPGGSRGLLDGGDRLGGGLRCC